MQDVGLFLSLAEIAGVFVGFGALIAVPGGHPSGGPWPQPADGYRWRSGTERPYP